MAGDPTQYTRADDLADYVLGKIAPTHIPDSIARDAEIEAWALVANASTLVPYAKLSNVVRSIGSLTYNTTSRALAINFQRSSGANEAASVILPEFTGQVFDWAELGNTDDIPEDKIPSLPTGKIIGIREYVEDRVGALIQDGDNLVWAYDDAANTLTGTVSTNLADVTQIIRDVVNPLGPGLTESFSPSPEPPEHRPRYRHDHPGGLEHDQERRCGSDYAERNGYGRRRDQCRRCRRRGGGGTDRRQQNIGQLRRPER